MKAVVSVTFDNEFVVHDIKVIEGEKGLFIAMPSKKSAEGEYRDIAHPISSATRDMIYNAILEAYDKAVAEEGISDYFTIADITAKEWGNSAPFAIHGQLSIKV